MVRKSATYRSSKLIFRRRVGKWAIAITASLFAAICGYILINLSHAAAPLSITTSGNRLVDQNGNTIVLHGVNRAGSEYACIQGWGIFDGPNVMNDDSQVPLMKSWGVNAVNIGINEDCWLGINGVKAAYSGQNYISAIEHEVNTLQSDNIYPIVSLFWMAPGTQPANGQNSMPDADHSVALWQSVANAFKNDPAVIFRLKEEPYPANNKDTTAAWQCWLNGGSSCNEGYAVAGMQTLINTIRATGAKNVIQVPGIEYANDMSQFLAYAPSDPDNHLMGVVDVYPVGNPCGSVPCYNSEYAPVIAKYPFAAGEFGEDVGGTDCTTTDVDALMSWFDQHGAGYLGWSWDTWGKCQQLITSYSTGSPNGAWGTDLKNHLLSVAAASSPAPVNTPSNSPTPTPGQTPASSNIKTPSNSSSGSANSVNSQNKTSTANQGSSTAKVAVATPNDLHSTLVTSSLVALAWNNDSNPSGVIGYRVYRNGVQVSDQLLPNYEDINLEAGTDYYYTVVAYDSAGDLSLQSAPLQVKTELATQKGSGFGMFYITPSGQHQPILVPLDDEPIVSGSVMFSTVNSSSSYATIRVDGSITSTNGKLNTTYLTNRKHTISISQNDTLSTRTIIVQNKLNPYYSLRNTLLAGFHGNVEDVNDSADIVTGLLIIGLIYGIWFTIMKIITIRNFKKG